MKEGKKNNKTKTKSKEMYQNTSQRVNVETCSANSMKTYKYKQKQINYKGAKKAQGKQLQSAKHPNKDNYNQLQSP